MSLFQPVERPAGRKATSWVFDALVTMAAVVTALPYILENTGARRVPAIVVLIVLVAPLLVRRIWPVTVFGWVLLISVGAGLWSKFEMAGLAVFIVLYTVAALRPRRDALTAAALVELAVTAAAVRASGGHWWYGTIYLTGLVAAALGLGLYSATRRAYLAELRDRAERLERERDQEGALAAAAERARIAREMHDIVAHHLTVMVALSDGAIAASAASPERAVEVMRSVSATGRRALADTRRLLGVLREPVGEDAPDNLQPVPNLTDLDALIAQVRAAGLATTLRVHGTAPDVPVGVQLTVYRLIQEALTNTLKHAGPAAQASVNLYYLPGELRVDVQDDGAGNSGGNSGGNGLAGMRERVHAYGGDIQAGPRTPSGWQITAKLRLDEEDAT